MKTQNSTLAIILGLTLFASAAHARDYPYCHLIGDDMGALTTIRSFELGDADESPSIAIQQMTIDTARAFDASNGRKLTFDSYVVALAYLKRWSVGAEVRYVEYSLTNALPDGTAKLSAVIHYPGDNVYGSLFISRNGLERIASVVDMNIRCVDRE